MKRGALVALVVLTLTLVIFTGCTGNTKNNTRKLTSFIGGSDGLSIGFVANAPPDKVLDESQEDFDISLDLENKGEFTISPNGIIATLSGIDREAFSLPSLSARSNFQIERKISDRGVTRDGGRDQLSFGTAKYKEDLASDFTTSIVADVCYNYRTVAATAVCLKKDTMQLKATDACLIDNSNVAFENSAAPIQVTKVETRKAGKNSVKVTFTVENKGSGIVYLPGTFADSCSGHERDESKLHVSVDSPSQKLGFKCDLFNGASEGDVKLYENKRQVSCVIDTLSLQETAYEPMINIQVDYMYRNAIKKDIKIENTNVL